ncbi:hypothetical protein KOEU_17520 [Komagataeibacter europaeus]|uniref:Uncharacterized protein n=1 Tax=Komagataeibacter europaeus TaxID=33995 RepID=A0A0M0EHN6_KOMEU|nr:hypothetical protein KOEU_17520 [Komagataeibacter europaeus]
MSDASITPVTRAISKAASRDFTRISLITVPLPFSPHNRHAIEQVRAEFFAGNAGSGFKRDKMLIGNTPPSQHCRMGPKASGMGDFCSAAYPLHEFCWCHA